MSVPRLNRRLVLEAPVRVADGVFTGEGTFEVSLEQHGVERPKLLLMPIRDTLSLAFVIKAPLPERTGS